MDSAILDTINNKLRSDFRLTKYFTSGVANENYLLKNNSGKRIVARVLKEQPIENVNLEFKIQKELLKHGVCTSLLLEEGGQPIVLKVGTQNITLTDFIKSGAPPKIDDKFLIQIGKKLAEFQLGLKDFNIDKIPPNHLSAEYQTKLRFSQQAKQTSSEIKSTLCCLYKKLVKLDLPKTLIHGDFNEDNYLTEKQEITAVLDLETVSYTYRILDLAIAIYYRAPEKNSKYEHIAKKIIEGYSSLIKLSKIELKNIPLATSYAAACFSLWSLSSEDYSEDFAEGFQKLMTKIARGFKDWP